MVEMTVATVPLRREPGYILYSVIPFYQLASSHYYLPVMAPIFHY